MVAQVLTLIGLLILLALIILIVWKGKDLLRLQMLQGSFFKQITFLFSSQNKAQKACLLSETGAISMEVKPLETGQVVDRETERSWDAIHALKFRVYKDGKPHEENEQVLLISERSHIPLDPNNSLTAKEKEKLASLKARARIKHAQVRAAAGVLTLGTSVISLVLYGSFVLMAFFGLLGFILQKWGGK